MCRLTDSTTPKDPELDLTAPIRDRLRQSDTGLRMTADPSLLVESLIDLSSCINIRNICISNASYLFLPSSRGPGPCSCRRVPGQDTQSGESSPLEARHEDCHVACVARTFTLIIRLQSNRLTRSHSFGQYTCSRKISFCINAHSSPSRH